MAAADASADALELDEGDRAQIRAVLAALRAVLGEDLVARTCTGRPSSADRGRGATSTCSRSPLGG